MAGAGGKGLRTGTGLKGHLNLIGSVAPAFSRRCMLRGREQKDPIGALRRASGNRLDGPSFWRLEKLHRQ